MRSEENHVSIFKGSKNTVDQDKQGIDGHKLRSDGL